VDWSRIMPKCVGCFEYSAIPIKLGRGKRNLCHACGKAEAMADHLRHGFFRELIHG